MTLTVTPSPLAGRLTAPPSKSMAHRYLLAAGLSAGTSRVAGIAGSEDISATIDCLRALGAEITLEGDVATVRGFDPRTAAPRTPLLCRESGSTLRFFLPLCWLSGATATMTGSERLLARPLSVYRDIAEREGLTFRPDVREVTVAGRLLGGEYTVPGDVSSQFITGLLFALPFTGRDSILHLVPPVESRSYLDLTVAALTRFGAKVTFLDEYTIGISAVTHLSACDCRVEGDYSNAAFFDALTALGHHVEVTGLDPESRQGDRVYGAYFSALADGCPTLSLADCPDLGPILMAVAAAKGGAHFTNTRRLRIKESDRGVAMAEELRKFGACITVEEDDILITPAPLHAPTAVLDGHNDHRIVMAVATLATLYGGTIRGAEAVRKSLPEYFTLLRSLGCEVTEHENE